MKSRFQFLFNEAAEGGEGGGGAAVAAEAPAYFNPDGTFGENWHVGLGDEFAEHAPSLTNFKDVKGLAKSYLHLRAHGPAYPGESSTPEDITRFHALAKVPVEGTPTAYGIAIPEDATDGDKAMYDRIAKVAHENHVSGPGFAAVVKAFQESQAAQIQELQDQYTAQQKAAQDELVSEWRGNFEANASRARHMATTLAEQAGIAPEKLEGLVNNPAFAKIMLQVSSLTSEDGIRAPSNLGDLRSAQQKAESIMDGSDPVWGKKYTDGTQEERVAAYNEVVRLQNLASK